MADDTVKRSAPPKTKPFVFLKVLCEVFPNVSPENLLKDAFELSKHENSEGYMALLENVKKQPIDRKIAGNLKAIYEEGYDIKHIFLYLQAPTESPLNDKTTQDEYLRLWNKEQQFKPRVSKTEILERGLMATKSLVVLVGATTVVPGIALGLYLNEPMVVETGKILAEGMIGAVKDLGEVLSNPTVSNVTENTLKILGLGVAGAAFKGQLKKAESIDLRSKIRDGADNEKNKQVLLKKLEDLPKASQHLISHFSPEETCLFLANDYPTQEKMWQKRPPSFEQRTLSNLVDGKENLMERLWNQAKLSGSSWDSDGRLNGPVTLKDSLLKLRAHKNSLSDKMDAPSAATPSL